MKWILAGILAVAMCGCEPAPLYRVSLYHANGTSEYWNSRNVFLNDGFVTFHDEETGERVHVSGDIVVEVERNAEKP